MLEDQIHKMTTDLLLLLLLKAKHISARILRALNIQSALTDPVPESIRHEIHNKLWCILYSVSEKNECIILLNHYCMSDTSKTTLQMRMLKSIGQNTNAIK